MQKKILLQLFIFLTIVLISIVFLKTYFFKKQIIFLDDSNSKNSNLPIDKTYDEVSSNLMYDIKYENKDKEGNGYTISSAVGKLNIDKPNFIFMEKVTAVINLKNSTPINIISDKASYNSLNYDTRFSGNVLAIFSEHNIMSDNFDVFFKNNEAIISNNIIYEHLGKSMKADKIKIDLITKNSTISMYDDLEKIEIINKN
tara:strand:+ start:1548 stop:2147 length:600 start_codon:yes stop_codon:yes gene_type:complete